MILITFTLLLLSALAFTYARRHFFSDNWPKKKSKPLLANPKTNYLKIKNCRGNRC